MGRITTNVFLILFALIFFPKLEHSSTYANASCMPDERKALVKFKGSLVDHSDRLSSWIGEDRCTWKGVVCSNTSHHVVRLDLRNRFQIDDQDVFYYDDYPGNYSSVFLKGVINHSLLDLKHLEFLDLSMNDFSGSKIPGFIASLTKLKYLNLSSSGFKGQVPVHLGNLLSLQYLDLGISSAFFAPSNSLTADNFQWVSTLSSLQYLDLSGMIVADADNWFHLINMLPSLLELHLSGCLLRRIPQFLNVNFTSLEFLDLRRNQFKSTIPHWLFNISNIQHLDLSENSFHGSIPRDMGSCEFIQVLDLHENNFEGEIPETLTNLCDLHKLDLESNNLRGEILRFLGSSSGCIQNSLKLLNLGWNLFTGYLPVQFGQFTRLEYLCLESNSFHGPIPPSLGRLSSLRLLNLGRNKLNGSVPECLWQLLNLEGLRISENLLTGVVSELHFANLRSLRQLSLSSNSLVLDLHPTWEPPFQLQMIDFSSCRIGPQFPQWLQKQKNIVLLLMSNASIFDAIPEWFEDISSNIIILDLSYNQITKFLPTIRSSRVGLGRSIRLNGNKFEGPLVMFPPEVTFLDLSSNNLSGSIPHSLCKMEALNALDLSKNHLSGRLPRCWKQLTSLEVIDLSHNNLSGHIPTSLGSVQLLRSLHLQNNSFQGKFPVSLMNLTYLETLDLGENALTGIVPSWVGRRLSNLEILSIHSNEFGGEIPREFCQLAGLSVLNLAENRFIGTIPRCFSKFSAMTAEEITSERWLYGEDYVENALVWMKGMELEYTKTLKFLFSIDISSNNLVGEIPKELMSLTRLQNLNLSGNKLEGVIPWNIGDLKMLESLDFSRNKLSGPIPPAISALNFLSYLNLSFNNNLSGHIPLGNQLQLFDEKSFIGNNRLCGRPLKICPEDESSEGYQQMEDKTSDDASEKHWFYYGLAMGFVVGFLGVCSNLYLMKSWRQASFQLAEKLYDSIRVTIAINTNRLRRKFNGGNLGERG